MRSPVFALPFYYCTHRPNLNKHHYHRHFQYRHRFIRHSQQKVIACLEVKVVTKIEFQVICGWGEFKSGTILHNVFGETLCAVVVVVVVVDYY